MCDTQFDIRHGEFIDVHGPPQRHNDITFVPARVSLNGTWFQSAFHLKDWMAEVPSTTKAIVHPGDDAPWVLGRLMRLFATQQIPEEDRGEKTCFYASFLAVFHNNENLAIPFECSDYYGRSALTFSTDDPPDTRTQETIAKTFWGLLLADPTDVADYEDKMYHSGAGVWITFGIEHGEPFMIENADGTEIDDDLPAPKPCPFCGEPLRSPNAQQCFSCGKDWHGTSPKNTA